MHAALRRSTGSHLGKLVAHLAWADAEALAALRDAPPGDGSALELYAHVLGAEHVWLARLRGVAPRVEVWPRLTLAGCEALAAENAAALADYVADLGEDDLTRGVDYRNSAGRAFTSTVEDMLLHVCLHGTYHRGQIAWLLRHGGAVPRPTDYIAFVRGAPAATRTPRT